MPCKASVIIPVYHAETTLRRCVESIVLGRERDIEVILVEDCSKDHSWKVCQELAQEFSNIIAVQNERNSGVSFTRNRGLELAQGAFILFVDSDDWVSENYARRLLSLAEENPSALPITGLHFIDKVHGARQDYIWDAKVGETAVIPNGLFFELSDRLLLQQLWNKIFRREIIEKFHIRFDETQSMGEDFQFVLDYLEAAHIQECVVLNEPLYYYIRWNDTSLMSQFGLIQNLQEYRRMEQLYRISGLDDSKVLERQIEGIKQNYVYQISRNAKLSRRERLDQIERIMGDGRSRQYYARQRLFRAKESVARQLTFLKRVPVRLKHKLIRMKRAIKTWWTRSSVKPSDVTIISQNCIGGVIYHDLGMQFLSPTINLFFKEPDFVRFVLNLEHYMACELEMRWEEEYPVGRLEDIEIHFMHYETCREAKEKWERRKQRINWGNILVLATDQEGFDEVLFRQWKQIPYAKVLFTAQTQYAQDQDSMFFPEYEAQGVVGDLISRREFYRDGRIMEYFRMNQSGGKTRDA